MKTKRIILIIAAICLIAVIAAVSIVLAHRGQQGPNEDSTHETGGDEAGPGEDNASSPNKNENYELGEDGKIDILTIPGAVKVNTSKEMFGGIVGDPAGAELYVENEKKSGDVLVYGTAKNINSVSVTDGARVWYITTFEIDVADDVKNLLDTSTVKAASICCYENDHIDLSLGLLDNNLKIYEQKTGLFSLKAASSDNFDTFEINGKQYSIAQLADYYAENHFECDGNSFVYYFDEVIELDKLRS